MLDPREIQIKVSSLAERRIAMFVLSKLCNCEYMKGSMSDDIEDLDMYPYVRYVATGVDASACVGRETISFNDLPSLWIKKEQKIEVKLNKEHTAVVTKKGIKVGCQSFPLDVIDKLSEAAKKVSKG